MDDHRAISRDQGIPIGPLGRALLDRGAAVTSVAAGRGVVQGIPGQVLVPVAEQAHARVGKQLRRGMPSRVRPLIMIGAAALLLVAAMVSWATEQPSAHEVPNPVVAPDPIRTPAPETVSPPPPASSTRPRGTPARRHTAEPTSVARPRVPTRSGSARVQSPRRSRGDLGSVPARAARTGARRAGLSRVRTATPGRTGGEAPIELVPVH